MEFKQLREYSIERLRDIYNETVQYGFRLEKQLNKDLPEMKWGVEVEWEGDSNIYIMISPLMNIPEVVDCAAYVSIDVLPFPQTDCMIGVSESNIDFMRENTHLLIDKGIVPYYEVMYKLLKYVKAMEL